MLCYNTGKLLKETALNALQENLFYILKIISGLGKGKVILKNNPYIKVTGSLSEFPYLLN